MRRRLTIDRQVDMNGERGLIRVAGEIDLFTTPQFRETMLFVLDTNEGLNRIDFDLSRTTFIDAAGLGILAAVMNILRSRNEGRVAVGIYDGGAVAIATALRATRIEEWFERLETRPTL